MQKMWLRENPILFGEDRTRAILSVELASDQELFVYRRENEITVCEKEPFTPFLWLAGDRLPAGWEQVRLEPLRGSLPFNQLAWFQGWDQFQKFRQAAREEGINHFALTDPVQQYLTITGRTLFKEMEFEDLYRIQLDIETFCSEGYKFSNAQRPSDHLMAIALSDSRGWEEFILIDKNDVERSESAAIERLNALIQEKDPDVIEGHNLFKFDLPYLVSRANRHRLKLLWGRDQTPISSRSSRLQIAERTIQYPKFQVRGRHIVDTFLLLQFYDIGTRELQGFGLKEAAKHFHIVGGKKSSTTSERTYLKGSQIQIAYLNDIHSFEAYSIEDVRETRALSDLLSRSYFVQTQIFPYNYQEIIVRGNATRVDALFLREYYHKRHSIPDLPQAQIFEGGYTDVFITGVKHNVWHCDVASLYPSLMLLYKIFPANDKLGIFESLINDLREFRLLAKAKMRETADKPELQQEHLSYSALQNVFKILINSFYGYLGFSQGHFADYAAAAKVTETGRALLKKMVEHLQSLNAEVIEIDTDGVYFVPPENTKIEQWKSEFEKVLPLGIEVEFDTHYQAMFSYKSKNYALLNQEGKLIIKGAALKSRGLEAFQRSYLKQMIQLLLQNNLDQIPALYHEFETKIRERVWPIDFLAKTDTLQDSLGVYQRKISASARNRSAAYELASRSLQNYQPGDQIRYYLTGEKRKVSAYENAKLVSEWRADQRDENVEYYVDKLSELANKYAEFTGFKVPNPKDPDTNQGFLFDL